MSTAPCAEGGDSLRVVVIVSTGRTGTRALADLLDGCHPEVRALHEPHPSRRLRLLSNRRLCGRIDDRALRIALARARAPLLHRLKSGLYVESNPFLHGCLEAFDAVFSCPRVVHVVRDPRTYVASYLRFGAFRGLKGWAARCIPYWMLVPDRYERHPLRRWKDMSQPERLAWRWNAVNGALERGETLFGERYLRVRYEDLFSVDGGTLRSVAEWMGVPGEAGIVLPAGKRINASPRDAWPAFEEWSRENRERLLTHCRERMHRYGYSTD